MRRVHLACLIQCLLFALVSAHAQVVDFGSVSVGSAGPVQTLTYNFSGATTLSAVNILTMGAAGLDYTDGGGSTCTAGTTYNANQSCTVAVAFTPLAPGLRSGAVTLFAQGGLPNLSLMTWYLRGIGQSGAVTIDPGTQSIISTLTNSGQAYGSAIDGAGNVYVVDHANSQIIELVAGGFMPSTVVASGLSSPTAVALDGAGNLYISDTGNSRVVLVPNEQGTLSSADMSAVPISGLLPASPCGIAVDGSGNLYVADSANSAVVEIPAGGGAQITLVSGLTSPYALALDGALNLYVAGNNQVVEYVYPSYNTTVAIGGSYSNPTGVAVDASGTVYVADSGNARVVRVAPGGVGQTTLTVTGLSGPRGVAVDSAANLYVTDGGNLYKVNRTQGAPLAFGSTYVGTTSTPQSAIVSNAGNQPVTVSNLATSANFTQVSSGTTCSASAPLSSSAQCSIALAFAPATSGVLTGTFTITNNSLSSPGSTQTVQLSGSSSQMSQTINFPIVPSQTYNAGLVTLNATATSGLGVSYAVTSGPATVAGNTLTITGAGSVMVEAGQAGNATYAAAIPVSQTFVVNQASQSITFTQQAPTTALYGSSFTVAANANSELAVSFSSSGACTNVGPTYTTANSAGTCGVIASQSGNGNFLAAAKVTESTTVSSKIAPTVTFTGAPSSAAYQSTFTIATTSNSSVIASITAAGTCSISGATVTITSGTGPCTLTAKWAATNTYLAASIIKTTTATKAAPAVAITGAPSTALYGSSFAIAATSNFGVIPAITATGACSISATTVTMTSGTGPCAMTAKWATNNNYLAASATQTTTAAKTTPTASITGAPASAPYQSTFTIGATSNSGIAATFTVAGVCTISAAKVTMTSGSGTCTITAKWVSNNNYLAASVSQATMAQKLASIITWPAPAPITYPAALSATQLNATANTPGKFVYSPAAGTVIPGGNQVLSVQFTPTSANYAPASGSTAVTVVQTLAITSANSTSTFGVGGPGSFTVTSTGYPIPALSEIGPLPEGVTFTDNGNGTGTLQGTPASTASGVFSISLVAHNGISANAVQNFTLTVSQVSAMVGARFLEQSSWGPTTATLAQVQQAGLQAYLQQQFSAPVSTYPTPAAGAALNVVQQQFFVNAVQGQDQLRQRVSFALSEIMVVSAVKVPGSSPFSLWMNMLQQDAFGNFYTLLNDVTLSPTMGFYLDMGNNNGCKTCRPNENYAREIQQLFTIGLTQLNLDGTPQLDQNGNPIPTYTQGTVDGFSQVFTGWSYPPAPGKSAVFGSLGYYSGPMLPYNANHAQGSKSLLNGTALSAGGDIQSDLTSSLQNIFNHPNVAPFICQQLIQKLVTSNPSPGYVSRVAQVFNNNGSGVAGDMQAVITAILLDPDARRGDDPAAVQASDGHLREPLLHMMTAMRAVNATTDGANLNNYAGNMMQAPFLSPDVFNFYPPNFQVPGTQLLGPEFDILNAGATVARINFINDLIYKSVGPHTTIDISPYVAVGGNVSQLLSLVNNNIMHGQMPSDMYNTLFNTLSTPAFSNPKTAAQAALYLTLSSSQFQVEH